MKRISTILLSMFAISGLVMAGSDAQSIFSQFVLSTIGVSIFGAAMWTIATIHRG